MTDPNSEHQLRLQCVELQAKLGIDDDEWRMKLGNNEGIYGWLKPILASATCEARREERQRYMSAHTGQGDNGPFMFDSCGTKDYAEKRLAELERAEPASG